MMCFTGKMEIVTTKLAESTDIGMKVPDPAKHYGISMPLEKPADPSDGFVFQYEVQLKVYNLVLPEHQS